VFTERIADRAAPTSVIRRFYVGHGQTWRLRNDPRVIVRKGERAGAPAADVPASRNLVTIDVGVISLPKILPELPRRSSSGGATLVALVKPQFEAGRGRGSASAGLLPIGGARGGEQRRHSWPAAEFGSRAHRHDAGRASQAPQEKQNFFLHSMKILVVGAGSHGTCYRGENCQAP